MIENYIEMKIDSYEDLISEFDKNNNFPGWIFRGQKNSDWLLTPSFYRVKDISSENVNILLARHLDKFKIFIRGRIDGSTKLSDDEVWSIGQHYGLYTPLLDWTASQYIALFFACGSKNTGCNSHALYCLNTKEINKYLAIMLMENYENAKELTSNIHNRYEIMPKEQEDLDIINNGLLILDLFNSGVLDHHYRQLSQIMNDNIILINPRIDNNPRLLSQRGIFTKTMRNKAIDEIIKETNWRTNKIILRKYIISEDLCNSIIECLNAMNINSLSLFPDLQGTSEYCNYKLIKEARLPKANIENIDIENKWL